LVCIQVTIPIYRNLLGTFAKDLPIFIKNQSCIEILNLIIFSSALKAYSEFVISDRPNSKLIETFNTPLTYPLCGTELLKY